MPPDGIHQAAEYQVTECGSDVINGLYRFDGLMNDGVWRFSKTGNDSSVLAILFRFAMPHWNSPYWYLSTAITNNPENDFYRVRSTGDFPPSSGWMLQTGGSLPLPNVLPVFNGSMTSTAKHPIHIDDILDRLRSRGDPVVGYHEHTIVAAVSDQLGVVIKTLEYDPGASRLVMQALLDQDAVGTNLTRLEKLDLANVWNRKRFSKVYLDHDDDLILEDVIDLPKDKELALEMISEFIERGHTHIQAFGAYYLLAASLRGGEHRDSSGPPPGAVLSVRGAGTDVVNGQYLPHPSLEGPRYLQVGATTGMYLIRHQSVGKVVYWCLTREPGSGCSSPTVFYRVSVPDMDSEAPPMEGWTTGTSGVFPPPFVVPIDERELRTHDNRA